MSHSQSPVVLANVLIGEIHGHGKEGIAELLSGRLGTVLASSPTGIAHNAARLSTCHAAQRHAACEEDFL